MLLSRKGLAPPPSKANTWSLTAARPALMMPSMTKRAITNRPFAIGDIIHVDSCFAGVKQRYGSDYMVLELDVLDPTRYGLNLTDALAFVRPDVPSFRVAYLLDLHAGSNVSIEMHQLRYFSVEE